MNIQPAPLIYGYILKIKVQWKTKNKNMIGYIGRKKENKKRGKSQWTA